MNSGHSALLPRKKNVVLAPLPMVWMSRPKWLALKKWNFEARIAITRWPVSNSRRFNAEVMDLFVCNATSLITNKFKLDREGELKAKISTTPTFKNREIGSCYATRIAHMMLGEKHQSRYWGSTQTRCQLFGRLHSTGELWMIPVYVSIHPPCFYGGH